MSEEIIEESIEISDEEFEKLSEAIEADSAVQHEGELGEDDLDSVTGGFAAATATIIAAIIGGVLGGGATIIAASINKKKHTCVITYKKKGRTYKYTVTGKKADKLCKVVK